MPLKEPKRGILKPIGDHPLTQGVLAVHAVSEYEAGKFDLYTSEHEPALSLMADTESGLGAFWITWVGGGTIIVSGYGSIFTNKMLAQANNADLVANIVAAQLGRNGARDLRRHAPGCDESFYDADAFFGDPRLHASFWWIIALWLVWVLGSTRLPPPRRAAAAGARARLHRGDGQFLRARDRQERRRAAPLRQLLQRLPPGPRRAAGRPAAVALDPRLMAPYRAMTSTARGALRARSRKASASTSIDLHNRLQHIRKQLA